MNGIFKTLMAVGLSLGAAVFAEETGDVVQLAKGKLGANPTFRLEKQSQVENLSEEPAMQWRDAADCRAEIFLAASGKGISVKIVVYDDIKFQNNDGPSIIEADSIQILLQVPGQKGFYNLAMALKGKTSQRIVIGVPEGVSAGAVRRGWTTFKCSTIGKTGVMYNTFIDYAVIGVDPQKDKILNLNIIVNDNDGDALKAKLSLVPGMNPEEFRKVSL